MSSLAHHQSLVQLYGVARNAGCEYLVTEFVPHGSLDRVLEQHAGKTSVAVRLRISQQICQALHALLWQGIIHCDLAARNVLVASFHTEDPDKVLVKVCDFGLSQEAISFVDTDSVVASRWAPPEVLQGRQYSPASDVWAFGVLLWEIFTDGGFPYSAISDDKEMAAQVSGGARLAQPRGCPDAVYALMLDCWHHQVDDRINFDAIGKAIHALVNEKL